MSDSAIYFGFIELQFEALHPWEMKVIVLVLI
jgi:hypothetical protein